MERPLLLVDAASLYFRAYHGIPVTLTAPDGTPVNAVRGFLDMLATLIRTRLPGRVICALDADWRPAWRVALLPTYKAHRLAPVEASGDTPAATAAESGGPGAAEAVPDQEATPDQLAPQIPIILAVLDALGIAALGVPGHEADDVIGTLAAREPGPIEVASGDRDLVQVVDDSRGVRLLYCGRGVANLEILDDAAVCARYGVPGRAYADLAVLRGDPSDGLPGVPGIGAKTASRLVSRYGGLAEILTALDDPTAGFAPGLRTRLRAATQYLAAARRVAAVRRDVPIPPLDAPVPMVPADPEAVLTLAERWGLAGPLRRIVDAMRAVGTG